MAVRRVRVRERFGNIGGDIDGAGTSADRNAGYDSRREMKKPAESPRRAMPIDRVNRQSTAAEIARHEPALRFLRVALPGSDGLAVGQLDDDRAAEDRHHLGDHDAMVMGLGLSAGDRQGRERENDCSVPHGICLSD